AGGRLELTSVGLIDSSLTALDLEGAGSKATLTHVTMTGGLAAGRAVYVSDGALTLSNVALANLNGEGLNVLGGTAALDDVAVVDLSSVGIRSQNTGAITGNHVSIERAHGA